MESREFIADSEQPDKSPTRWIHRPFDVPLQPPIHDGVPYHLPFSYGSFVPGDPPTSIDLHYVSHPASLFDQQSADPIENIHTQDAHRPGDVQLQLAEVEWQHEIARYEILEKAQAIPTISHIQEAPASYPYAAMGEPAAGYAGVYDTPNVPVRLPPIPNQDFTLDHNSSAYGVDAGLWPAHRLTQTAVYPGSTRDHVGGYGQQPSLDPMALTASNFNTMPSALSPHDQGNYPSAFMAAYQLSFSQQIPPLHNFGVAPVATSQLPTNATSNLVCDATCSMPLWNENTEPSADHSSVVVAHELPSFPTINHSAVSGVESIDTFGPQAFTGAIRRQAGRGKWRQSISTSPYDRGTVSSRAVDNIQFHTSPEADRHRQRTQPRIYSKRSKKVKWSCFGCRLSKRSCEDPAHGVCLRCQNILKKYSDRTVLPRFTCDVKTKFSEIPIFTDVPAEELSDMEISTKLLSTLPHPLKIAWEDGFPPVTIGHSKLVCRRDADTVVERLMCRVRILLDILEPLHPRQLMPIESHYIIPLSYSFSLIRWRSAICFFMPDLEDVLNFHEHYHRCILGDYLWHLDWHISSGRYNDAAILLTVLHEGILGIRNTSTVNTSAKDHLLASLRYHALHLYRHQFPMTPVIDTLLRYDPSRDRASFYGLFTQTSGLLPAGYRPNLYGHFPYHFSRMQKQLSLLDCLKMAIATETYKNDRAMRDTLDRVKRLLQPSALEAYFPARVLTIFGMSQERTDVLEGVVQKRLDEVDPDFAEDMHNMSPWSLSIGLRAFFDRADVGKHTNKSKESILTHIMLSSLSVWDVCLDYHRRSGPSGEYPGLRNMTMTDRYAMEALMMDWYARDLARVDQEDWPCEVEETLDKAAAGEVCDK